MNYEELKNAICSYSENYEQSFVASLDTFIKQAELHIQQSVQLPTLRKTSVATIAPGQPYLATPDDFLSVHSIAVYDSTGAFEFLIDKDANLIREAYPFPAVSGRPRYYALFGTRTDTDRELSFLLGPTPDAGYTAEMTYSAYPASITTTGNSWLGDNFDTVLLYGSLIEACIFMKGEADVMTAYKTRFEEALGLLKQLGDGKMRRDSYRDGQVRTEVR